MIPKSLVEHNVLWATEEKLWITLLAVPGTRRHGCAGRATCGRGRSLTARATPGVDGLSTGFPPRPVDHWPVRWGDCDGWIAGHRPAGDRPRSPRSLAVDTSGNSRMIRRVDAGDPPRAELSRRLLTRADRAALVLAATGNLRVPTVSGHAITNRHSSVSAGRDCPVRRITASPWPTDGAAADEDGTNGRHPSTMHGGHGLGILRLACLLVLSALVFLPGLGSSGRLSYHEAFVAQGAREILDSGNWAISDDRRLALAGEAADALVAGRRAGPMRRRGGRDGGAAPLGAGRDDAGRWASRWWRAALRGGHRRARRRRPGDDGLGRDARPAGRGRHAAGLPDHLGDRRLRPDARAPIPTHGGQDGVGAWGFFVLLGRHLAGQGDRLRRGADPVGRGGRPCSGVATARRSAGSGSRPDGSWRRCWRSAWPMAMVARHGGALALWTMHVTDRLAAHPGEFAGEPWWEYAPGLLFQAMPWTPLALIGAWHSLRRAIVDPRGSLPARPAPATVARGRPAALGLVDGAAGPALAGDGEERALCDLRPGPVVDLGGAGPGAAGGPAGPPRLDARPAAAPGRSPASPRWGWSMDSASGSWAPGSTDAGDRVGLLRISRPATPARRRWPCSTTTGTATRTRVPSARSRTTWPSASSTWAGRQAGTRAGRLSPAIDPPRPDNAARGSHGPAGQDESRTHGAAICPHIRDRPRS